MKPRTYPKVLRGPGVTDTKRIIIKRKQAAYVLTFNIITIPTELEIVFSI